MFASGLTSQTSETVFKLETTKQEDRICGWGVELEGFGWINK